MQCVGLITSLSPTGRGVGCDIHVTPAFSVMADCFPRDPQDKGPISGNYLIKLIFSNNLSLGPRTVLSKPAGLSTSISKNLSTATTCTLPHSTNITLSIPLWTPSTQNLPLLVASLPNTSQKSRSSSSKALSRTSIFV